MAVFDPGIRPADRLSTRLRLRTRLAVVVLYVLAFVVAILLVQPAFRDGSVSHAPSAQTDVIRKGETVSTFAARHGLELGDLLALNPSIDSLSLPPGTKLRVG